MCPNNHVLRYYLHMFETTWHHGWEMCIGTEISFRGA